MIINNFIIASWAYFQQRRPSLSPAFVRPCYPPHSCDLLTLPLVRASFTISWSGYHLENIPLWVWRGGFCGNDKEDIQNLSSVLDGFGEVTDLCTNFQKSCVVPIRCEHVNLDDALQGHPVARTSFPWNTLSSYLYLASSSCGLPKPRRQRC